MCGSAAELLNGERFREAAPDRLEVESVNESTVTDRFSQSIRPLLRQSSRPKENRSGSEPVANMTVVFPRFTVK